MRILVAVIGILLFAVVTAVLTLWGLRRAYFQKDRLARMLFSKASGKVMHYLKTHDTVNTEEIRTLIKGTEAKEFMSKNTAVILGDDEFITKLTELMCKDNLIEPAAQGKNVYKKKNRKGGN